MRCRSSISSRFPSRSPARESAACASSREATERSDVIIIMVPDTPHVEAALFGKSGVAEGLSRGKTVVDMSSISPLATKGFAKRINDLGCDYLDAPVSGGEVGAKNATLSIMVGGPEAAFNRVKPLFEVMGKNITLVGGNGDGQTTKVANQIIVALNIEAVAEALLFAAKAGADPARVRQALMGGFASSKILEVHGERMVKRTFDPGLSHRAAPEGPESCALQCAANGRVLAKYCNSPGIVQCMCGTRRRGVGPLGDGTCARTPGQLRNRSEELGLLELGLGSKHCDRFRCSVVDPFSQAIEILRAMDTPRELLRQMFDAAIAAAQPALCLPPHLPPRPAGRLIVIGAGKASAAMARAVEENVEGPLEGLVVTRYGYGVPCERIEIVEAAHPVPDAAGIEAARRIREKVSGLTADDLVLCLISGGGSSLLAAPAPGLTLADKQAVNRALLKSGANISEMNCVRRHLSALKGGRLAAACYPAKVVTLLMSDVPGDDPIDIASGPTVPDPTTCDDALAIIRRYAIEVPANVRRVLESGEGETVKPGDPRLAGIDTRMIATPQMALEAAALVARAANVPAHILGDSLEGEARDVGKVMGGIALQVAGRRQPFTPPCVLLSGGETTVTVRGKGRGGRNVEFLLSLGITLHGHPGIHAIAGDTDGVDGQEEIAGALLAPDTLDRAWRKGINPNDSLADNDGHGFFGALGDSVVTGPTLTNVNDFRAILIDSDPENS